jgi:hypothetical protein
VSIEAPSIRILTFSEYVSLPKRPSLRMQLPLGLRQQVFEQKDGCWRWTGHLMDEGHGRARFLGREHAAHWLVWRLLRGELEGKDLHHTCGFAACVRPLHLKPMSPSEHSALHGDTRRRRREPAQVSEPAEAAA